jgi:hypothetical protein
MAGLSYAWAKWKESQSWVDDNDADEGDGDQPVTPYGIDPQRDPADWWKQEPK